MLLPLVCLITFLCIANSVHFMNFNVMLFGTTRFMTIIFLIMDCFLIKIQLFQFRAFYVKSCLVFLCHFDLGLNFVQNLHFISVAYLLALIQSKIDQLILIKVYSI